MSSINDANKFYPNWTDQYGNYIGPKESLEAVLQRNMNDMSARLNNHIDDVKNNIEGITMDISNHTSAINSLSTANTANSQRIDELNLQVFKLTEIFKILTISCAGLIDVEGVKNLIKMKESPDSENHVMAEEVINRHLNTLGITITNKNDGTDGDQQAQ